MIPIPSGVRVWIATGHTDMRRGMRSLALTVQESLKRDPHAGDLYIFRGSSRRSGQDTLARWAGHVALRQLRAFILQLLQLQLRVLAPLPS